MDYGKGRPGLAPVTIISETHAIASYHIFEEFIPKKGEPPKLLTIFSQFSDKKYEVEVDKHCDGDFCQIILFKAAKPDKFDVPGNLYPTIGVPMIGWPYFALVCSSRCEYEWTSTYL